MLRHDDGMILNSHDSGVHARPIMPAISVSAGAAVREVAADKATANAKPVLQGAVASSRVQLASKPAEIANQNQPKPAGAKSDAPSTELTQEQQRAEQKLKQTDAKVRAHERAHSAAGGSHAGSASYEFAAGPSGRRYAVSGEVSIDASPVKDNPEATIRKMDVVISAALAPADPSSQDLAVARQAQAARAQAQTAATKQREAENSQSNLSETDAAAKSQDSAKPTSASAHLQANAAYEASAAYEGTSNVGFVADNGAVANEIFSALFA